MALTLYEVSIPVFLGHLKALSKLLEKGVAFTKEDGAKITEEQLVDSRLIADMGNLAFQIQRVSDLSKGVAARIGGVEPIALPDTEKTFPELLERIQKSIEILEKVKPEHINAQENTEVTLKTIKGELKFSAKEYVLQYALPNFYFHYVTAYALLRKEGVQIGKANYLGRA